jgi:ADP-heptose:LPS heptosyltransferase
VDRPRRCFDLPGRRAAALAAAPRRGLGRTAVAGVASGRPVADAVRPGGRILLFRALPGIGDLLCAIPAIRAIRSARPDVSITLVTLPATIALAERYPHLLDRVVAFPGFPGLPDRRPAVRDLPSFLADLQAQQFDLAVQFHGSGELTNEIVSLFGARHVASFHRPGSRAPEPARSLPWHEDESEIRRWLRLVEHLGWPATDVSLELPLADDAAAQLLTALDGVPLPGRPYAVVHPGASVPERRWSTTAFADVVRRLRAAGVPVVLTGSSAERRLTAEVRCLAADDGVIDLAGATTLDALGRLVADAAVVVTNDTGVSHIAAALRTPSVVLFASTAPARWAPLDTTRHRAITRGSASRVAAAALAAIRGSARGADHSRHAEVLRCAG